MSDLDRGPISTYEVTWRSGHVDTVPAHQVSHSNGRGLFDHSDVPAGPMRVRFHGEIAGRWQLMIEALEDDILSIRNVTHVADSPDGADR